MAINRTTLLPSFDLKRNSAKNLSEIDQPYFSKEMVKHFHPVSKAVVSNALLVVEEGIVIKHWHILSESLMDEGVRNWFGISYYLKAYRTASLLPEDRYLYVYNHYAVGYGHWLADVLPRLFLLKEDLLTYKILLPANYTSFHFTTLAPFGISSEQLVYLDRDKVYQIPHLTLVAHVGTSCNTKDEVLQELRAFYLNHYLGPDWPIPFRKLYISRSRMKNRKVINEQEIELLLQKQGFEILYPEEYNFEQQVKLFSECQMLIGLTGSGLTNTLFMQKGSAVVEFKMKGDHSNLHYFSMASGMQLDYYYLLCEAKGEDRFTADFNVDVAALESLLISAENNSSIDNF